VLQSDLDFNSWFVGFCGLVVEYMKTTNSNQIHIKTHNTRTLYVVLLLFLYKMLLSFIRLSSGRGCKYIAIEEEINVVVIQVS